jgi:SAM-dependent MidA family methyltransferase
MQSPKPDTATLPKPGAEYLQQSTAVREKIERACNENGGLIDFSEYMQIALYAPGLGYYSGGLCKFGEQGDFVTAPEVSHLFSECLANQVADILPQLDEGCVIEFGAGSGVMAADILLHLKKLDSLPERYYILEVSAELKQRQQAAIEAKGEDLLECVIWLDAMPGEPLNAVVLANEVLDAMPVECFRKSGNRIEQLVIGFESGGLLSDYRQADDEVSHAVNNIEQRTETILPDGYCSEVNLNIKPWLASVYSVLNAGVVLLIDYGYTASEYYHAQRSKGTLMCHYQHRAHTDPFWYPGLQDITAYVDFTDVAHAGADIGFGVRGFTTQAAFLMSCGLADLHQQYVSDDPKNQIELSQQIKTLTLPSEMGDRFKVMALTKDHDAALLGFMLQDHRGKL